MSIQSEISRISSAVGAAYDAVSAKGGTTPASMTVANLASAIGNIPAGATVQTYSGSFTTDNSGGFSANCGFPPDLVYIYFNSESSTPVYHYYLAVPLLAKSTSQAEFISCICFAHLYSHSDYLLVGIDAAERENGFFGYITGYYYNFGSNPIKGETFNYTAVKWTV